MDVVINKLDRLHVLDPDDRAAIRALPYSVSRVKAQQRIVGTGDIPSTCPILLDGFAFRSNLVTNGNRQIFSFHVPGDLLGIQQLSLLHADHSIHTLTDGEIATVPLSDLRAMLKQRPAVAEAIRRDVLIEASIFREWILNIGRRDGATRVAHMLCEFVTRRVASGSGRLERFEVPMSQEQIADATGLTGVHVNRMLKKLGDMKLIRRINRHYEISNWSAMQRFAGFDPLYLHLGIRNGPVA